MQYIIPGTVVACREEFLNNAFAQFEPVFTLTKGMTLSQVADITGLEPSTIQNWVRRGWIARPIQRSYSKQSFLRILLINSMRGVLQIEKRVRIMEYINGDVEDTSDDIISDEQLFNIYCSIIFSIAEKQTDGAVTSNFLKEEIKKHLEGYEEKEAGTAQRLHNALYVMAMAYFAARIMELSNRVFDNCIKQKDNK